MITIEPGLYVRVEEMAGDRAPVPRPLASGFSRERAYRVLGAYTASESSEAFLILSNDRDELWFISNKHLRTVATAPGSTAFRLDLPPPRAAGGHAPLAGERLRASPPPITNGAVAHAAP